ncbi:MAG: gamma-glutamyltransferase [Gammaproteobacteria bacterium]|nr:gamma-glutamyltransferase [Gammaproteobacteria bacterium]
MRGLATLLARYGTLAWADAIAPAAQIARDGFMVGQTLAASWRNRARDPRRFVIIKGVITRTADTAIEIRLPRTVRQKQ